MKPTSITVAPLATEPFHDALRTVTVFADCENVPFQPCETTWLPGKSNVRAQLDQASPTFWMLKLPVKPVGHSARLV
ncbi:hypothetical protein GCM10009681_16990 [Luedemannella helvata]|uniref:Uncharacterized protein n=1 Tax=Luedemannella helvata TaxID=349315 RepID=A0ABP4W3I3_9ACTN